MRILGARIFSKFFGGKIKNFNEGSREKIKGTRVYHEPIFFLSFWAGNLKINPRVKFRQSRQFLENI